MPLPITHAFAANITGWATVMGGGSASIAWNALGHIDFTVVSAVSTCGVASPATTAGDLALDGTYKVAFRAKSTVGGELMVSITESTGLTLAENTQVFTLTTDWQDFESVLVLTGAAVGSKTFNVNFMLQGEEAIDPGVYSIDDVVLSETTEFVKDHPTAQSNPVTAYNNSSPTAQTAPVSAYDNTAPTAQTNPVAVYDNTAPTAQTNPVAAYSDTPPTAQSM